MKKIFLTISMLILLSTACTKDGSKLIDPTTVIGINAAFGNANNANQFLLDIYRAILPVLPRTDFAGSRWRNNYLLDVADENGSTNAQGNQIVRDWNAGAVTAGSTGVFSYKDWTDSYASIRACNLFLAHINDVPYDAQFQYDAAAKKIRIAEAKWLLAFNYAELAKEFGGLPIIKGVLDPSSDFNIPRSTYDETIAYITGLCDEAAADLPLVYSDADLGRATKGAALALKARMLLYAASPLWNDSSAPNDTYLSGKYDATKWQKAAQAAKDVMDLNQYQLYPDLSTLFTSRTNSEIIYARMQEPMAYFTATNVPYKLYPSGAYPVGGNNQVTYNMVKQYEVLKGGVAYSIDDASSGYNPQDPYKNRDPRFYRDCIYNGAKVLNKTAEFGTVAAGVTKVVAHNNVIVSPYDTYVFSTKFCDLTLNITADARTPSANGRTGQNYPYLRYAEILMNYAEAMNEAYGPEALGPGFTMTALQAVNQVRTRAKYVAGKQEYLGQTGGMPPIPSGLSQSAFRTILQHERRVEFSFEEHYFWDIRRWKQTPNNTIQAQIPVWTSPTTVQYQITTIDNRYWDPKMLRMPIPQSELFANPKLQQNPGW
ncbi:RagB/SusD family nutrient uptake outer membrane protein [Mucilaginibacter boryungensis]|uniref:RagB/SusD family nutrient uptake outer membrane protein n=1 Tax=Mucilaginibacter boryungensis TaxID=768480 RepID=A0ABR9XDL8_9SPHI|nr:RagB/SusD family nutrient uptake outer membrane protein [Mucilaginibacter boryungensis]MBE9665489.1 RagB/SusD family nutrient uptake outer membrane protein [Mucilaginibacter boryungensis]